MSELGTETVDSAAHQGELQSVADLPTHRRGDRRQLTLVRDVLPDVLDDLASVAPDQLSAIRFRAIAERLEHAPARIAA